MNDKLLYLIKTKGWRITSKIVGGSDVLFKILDLTPDKFLQSFNHLEQSTAQVATYNIFYGYDLFIYDTKHRQVMFNYEEIWSLLEFGFKMNHKEIKNIIKKWLCDVYKINDVDIDYFYRS
jgi:hypothetical protein